jgi:hypothetical protein
LQKSEVVQRARFVRWFWGECFDPGLSADSNALRSDILKRDEIGLLLDEEMTDDEKKELEECGEVCQRFVRWKMSAQDEVGVKERLRAVLGG